MNTMYLSPRFNSPPHYVLPFVTHFWMDGKLIMNTFRKKLVPRFKNYYRGELFHSHLRSIFYKMWNNLLNIWN